MLKSLCFQLNARESIQTLFYPTFTISTEKPTLQILRNCTPKTEAKRKNDVN